MASRHKYNCVEIIIHSSSQLTYVWARFYYYDRLVFHTFCVCLKFKETARLWWRLRRSSVIAYSHFEILWKNMLLQTGNTLITPIGLSQMINPNILCILVKSPTFRHVIHSADFCKVGDMTKLVTVWKLNKFRFQYFRVYYKGTKPEQSIGSFVCHVDCCDL